MKSVERARWQDLRDPTKTDAVYGEEFSNASRVLIHCLNFYPEFIGCGKYAAELAFDLARRGRTVEVVTAPPHYPGWSVIRPYKYFAYSKEAINGVAIRRCPILMKRGGGLWRALAPISFAVFAAPAALAAGKLVGARTVLHVQDLEMDAAFNLGFVRSRVLRRAVAWFERFTMRRFDRIVTISRKMREALIAKAAPAERIFVIRNWVDLDAVYPLPTDAPNGFRKALGLAPEMFVALYAGHIGRKQALDVMLDAAEVCRGLSGLHFVVAGDGPCRAELAARYGGLPNVTFLPLQPIDRFNALLNFANIHVLPQARDAADLVLPSKLGGMLASGRPIVATVEPDTELANMLEDVAILVPAGDPIALADAIVAASTRDLSELAGRALRLGATLSDKSLLAAFELALMSGKGPERYTAA